MDKINLTKYMNALNRREDYVKRINYRPNFADEVAKIDKTISKMEKAIEDMLLAANGKAKERTVSIGCVVATVRLIEKQFPVRKNLTGLRVSCFPHATNVPSAYRYKFMQTFFVLSCDGKSWYLDKVNRIDNKKNRKYFYDFSACDCESILNSIFD